MKCFFALAFLLSGAAAVPLQASQKKTDSPIPNLKNEKIFRCLGRIVHLNSQKKKTAFSFGTSANEALNNLQKACFELGKDKCTVTQDGGYCDQPTAWETGIIASNKPWKCRGKLSIDNKTKEVVSHGEIPNIAVENMLAQCGNKKNCKVVIEACVEDSKQNKKG